MKIFKKKYKKSLDVIDTLLYNIAIERDLKKEG